jgi:hypothetical protein
MVSLESFSKSAVYMKVDSERKERWEQAAESLGLSLTSFLTEAADRATEAAERRGESNVFHKFIRNLSREATRGGSSNWAKFGRGLAGTLDSLQPGSSISSVPEWWIHLLRLEQLLSRAHPRKDELVLEWFQKLLPSFVEAVPARRHQQFLRGVYEAWAEGECRFWVYTALIESERIGGPESNL